MKIKLVHHKEIDFSKWDECINRSINGIVYGYSWYLDIVANEWDALVGDDYDAVFPLVHGKKYGIPFLYQPFFTQQLGLFSKSRFDNQLLHEFISAIPSIYKYQIINFNTFIKLDDSYNFKNRITYQLDLIQPYFAISSKYNDNTKRNISKSIAMGVTVVKGLPVNEFIKFKKKNLTIPLKKNHLEMIARITRNSGDNGLGEIYAAYSTQNELCAASLFIRSNGKVIYLFAASNEVGRNNRAMFSLVDSYINRNSESQLVLDFEGSMIENVARFYAGFGATPCTYQQLLVNRLPRIIKSFL
ncbi:MAG: hypothetical protein AB9846_09110 [Tenuifilaceae bacterium]